MQSKTGEEKKFREKEKFQKTLVSFCKFRYNRLAKSQD